MQTGFTKGRGRNIYYREYIAHVFYSLLFHCRGSYFCEFYQIKMVLIFDANTNSTINEMTFPPIRIRNPRHDSVNKIISFLYF